MINLVEYEKYLFGNEAAYNTRRSYLTTLRMFNEFAEEHGYYEFSIELMIAYKRYLIEVKRHTPQTVNNKLVIVSSYLRYLEKINPGFKASELRVKQVKVQSNVKREYIVKEEYDALLMVCSHAETRMLMKLISKTGLRISEALSLSKADIEPIEISITNKGKTRVIGMSNELKNELRAFFSDRSETEPMFKYSQATYRNHMKKSAKVCDVDPKKVYPHAFRHYFAKDFLKNSKDERALSMLQAILGHSDIKTTMIYLQFNNSELAAVMMA